MVTSFLFGLPEQIYLGGGSKILCLWQQLSGFTLYLRCTSVPLQSGSLSSVVFQFSFFKNYLLPWFVSSRTKRIVIPVLRDTNRGGGIGKHRPG